MSTDTEFEVHHASVASDSSGNFLVAWTLDGLDGDASGIFGERFDSNGNPLGGEFAVNT